MDLLIIYARFPEDEERGELMSFILNELQSKEISYIVRDLREDLLKERVSEEKKSLSMALSASRLLQQREILKADKVIVITSSKNDALPPELDNFLDSVFTKEFMFNLIEGNLKTYSCRKQFGIIRLDSEIEKLLHKSNKVEMDGDSYRKILKDLNAEIKFNLLLPQKQALNGLTKESQLELKIALDCLINSCDSHIPGKMPE
ncbi:MAG: NAD(P)H-dependent oxidoreductase [Bacteroidales bacterium]